MFWLLFNQWKFKQFAMVAIVSYQWLTHKSYVLGFSIMWTKNFQMSKLGLEKEKEPEIKLPTFTGS